MADFFITIFAWLLYGSIFLGLIGFVILIFRLIFASRKTWSDITRSLPWWSIFR